MSSGPSVYQGCFHDIKKRDDRDLTKFEGQGVTRQACESLCRAGGYTYFGRQWLEECWCGNGVGRQGEAAGCECDAQNIGADKACVYRLGDQGKSDGRVKAATKHLLRGVSRRTGLALDLRGHHVPVCQGGGGGGQRTYCEPPPRGSVLEIACTECEEGAIRLPLASCVSRRG